MTQVIDPEDADLFDDFGNGSLHLYAVSAPGWIPYQEGDACYLNLDFHYTDWEALLWNALLDGKFKYDEYVKGENVNEHQERNRKKFQQSIPDYPMLARIFDM